MGAVQVLVICVLTVFLAKGSCLPVGGPNERHDGLQRRVRARAAVEPATTTPGGPTVAPTTPGGPTVGPAPATLPSGPTVGPAPATLPSWAKKGIWWPFIKKP
ncbi:vegetative cell wall protein gp1-like [Micropterus salmoides]|uniref:vegetative cell wall protein gp1-like n=1 Tax=Micropterus salmoides TaxID=27706 RepID=UPI0018ED8067|nr:vegetative cell wall protein gp1-like [Micropterus salmoides]